MLSSLWKCGFPSWGVDSWMRSLSVQNQVSERFGDVVRAYEREPAVPVRSWFRGSDVAPGVVDRWLKCELGIEGYTVGFAHVLQWGWQQGHACTFMPWFDESIEPAVSTSCDARCGGRDGPLFGYWNFGGIWSLPASSVHTSPFVRWDDTSWAGSPSSIWYLFLWSHSRLHVFAGLPVMTSEASSIPYLEGIFLNDVLLSNKNEKKLLGEAWIKHGTRKK